MDRNNRINLLDNPILDRLIVVGTKALRRGLMSGETLRAPRQQLRWFTPRPSFFFAYPLSKSNWINHLLAWKFIFPDFFRLQPVGSTSAPMLPLVLRKKTASGLAD